MIMIRRFALAFVLLSAPAARADVLALYDFTGQPGDQAAQPPAAPSPLAVASAITRGPGITPNAGDNSINSRTWTTTTTPAPDDYYQFSISPLAGVPLHFTSLDYTDRRSLEGPTAVQVQFSLDGFATPGTPLALYTFAAASVANLREIVN
jgi:hypothetical protein